jgi:tripartite-type tricarboxylate transporter receptor subunit TctC
MRHRTSVALGLAVLVGAAAGPAKAEFPERPIEFLCATSAGSGAANWCLLVGELTSENLGQPVEVLFRPAGAGNEAATYVDQRPADGYTWLQRNTSYAGYMNLPTFRPDPDNFEVVAEVEKFVYVLGTRSDKPWQTFEELIEDMRERPGAISVGGNKPGSAHHLHLVKLFEAAGVDWNFVPYDGAGEALRDALGGHVDIAIGPPGIWQSHVDSGDARYLILINEEPIDRPGLAELPIPSDFGLDYEMIHQVQGVFLKTGTPEDVVERVQEAFRSVVEHPRYQEYLQNNTHVVPQFDDDVEAATERFRLERDTMGETLRGAGLL